MKVEQVVKLPEVVLKEAAALIRQYGWCRGWGRKNESYCLMQAVGEAAGAIKYVRTVRPGRYIYAVETVHEDNPTYRAADALVRERIHALFGDEAIGPLYHWNDSINRTKDEVLRVLEGE